MNNTMMDDYKSALNDVKDTFTRDDAKNWTTIDDVNDYIKLLLNDDLMMQNKNDFTFSERTLITRHNLLIALGDILIEDVGKDDGYFEKAKTVFTAISGCSVSIRAEKI